MRAIDAPLLERAAEFVRSGSVIWDIGANLGLFSFAAASLAGVEGSVVAVEPDAWLVSLLRRSARLPARRAPVTVVPAAVSDKCGLASFRIARRNRATNYLAGFGTTQTGGIREEHFVSTLTLDTLADHFPIPDLVKIDVEGAENLVLAGGEHIFAHGPTVICEVATENIIVVTDYFTSLGYSLYDGTISARQRRPLDRAVRQTLAVREK